LPETCSRGETVIAPAS